MNARAIMSNQIPSMPEARDRPYCIWHPQVASQATYRKLWQQYPEMAYQVARACAVANYVELYLEMNLLPDVSIAEEARASGSTEIFEAIMRSPIKYRIMNDYTREVTLRNCEPGFLNDDTALVSTLDIKQGITKPYGFEQDPIAEAPESWEEAEALGAVFDEDGLIRHSGFDERMFNITEDMNVGEVNSEEPQLNYLPELLSQPLPADLPRGNKDVLILMAAYYGNIERYARLRRARVIDKERGCLVRGIYHNSMFALWCATQIIQDEVASTHVRKAIHARMIMNNDLSRAIDIHTMQPSKDLEYNMPYLIWFPGRATSSTYKTLARAVPKMRPAVLHAAVYTRDKNLFDWLLDDLGTATTLPALQEASVQKWDLEGGHSSYFERRLKARSEELEIDLSGFVESWKMYTAKQGQSSDYLAKDLTPDGVHSDMEDWGFYNGYIVDASQVELWASAPKSWRPDWWKVELDYEDWPERERPRE
jgi:hypothetical protein